MLKAYEMPLKDEALDEAILAFLVRRRDQSG
jgi:hypothetical protein